jgi:uncharacterized membrane protein
MFTKLRLLLSLILFILVLTECTVVQASTEREYTIVLRSDGSATWTVEEQGIDVSTSLSAFTSNVSFLMNEAMKNTERNMTAESFFMSINVSGSYEKVTYRFVWNGFAQVEDGQIAAGDVFAVPNFFSYLLGDGEVYILYPSAYNAVSVFPQPQVRNDSAQMIEWFGTADFKLGEPKIILKERPVPSLTDVINGYAVLVLSLIALISAGLISLYYFRFWKKGLKKETAASKSMLPSLNAMEDDEAKVIRLLRASGGQLRQSMIVDRCEFSRSKTSQLMKTMENEGKIRRENKGREKLVILLENQG